MVLGLNNEQMISTGCYLSHLDQETIFLMRVQYFNNNLLIHPTQPRKHFLDFQSAFRSISEQTCIILNFRFMVSYQQFQKKKIIILLTAI